MCVVARARTLKLTGALLALSVGVSAFAQAPREATIDFHGGGSLRFVWFGPSRASELPKANVFCGGPVLTVPIPPESPDSETLYSYDPDRNLLSMISYRELLVLNGSYSPNFIYVAKVRLRLPESAAGGTVLLVDSSEVRRQLSIPPDGLVEAIGLREGPVHVKVKAPSGDVVTEEDFSVSTARAVPIPEIPLGEPRSGIHWVWWPIVGLVSGVGYFGFRVYRNLRRPALS